MRTTLLAMALALVLAGCNRSEPETTNDAVQGDAANLADTASSNAAQPTAEPNDASEPADPNMSAVTLDGSSTAAFENSLQEFAVLAGEDNAAALDAAIDYLLVYDIASRGNREKLYERLNGLTPAQVIEAAEVQKGRR